MRSLQGLAESGFAVDIDAGAAEGFGQLEEVGRLWINPDFGNAALDHAVANHRVAVVVPNDDRDCQAFLDRGGEFVDGEHETAVADQRDHVPLRLC